jgi:hypothetical protein
MGSVPETYSAYKTIADVEFATAAWADWYNSSMHPMTSHTATPRRNPV